MQRRVMDSEEKTRSRYVGRLAPAPTGALHLGNARTFLVAWLRARLAGGRLVLRLEDLDHPKVKPEAATDAYADLRWLGLDWDAGPAASFPAADARSRGDGSERDPYIQSNRRETYAEALACLRRKGLIYPCVCTRKELDAVQSAPNAGEDLLERRYPGACRDRFPDATAATACSGKEPGWRFKVADGEMTSFRDGFHGWRESALSEWSGDFLVARGEAVGYQLAVVVDDNAMGVTEAVRGDDLLPSTHRQLALYKALGYSPPSFYHLPLVVGADGRRLAKRHGDTRLGVLRRAGDAPDRVLGWLAWSCGWAQRRETLGIGDIVDRCDFASLPREKIVLDNDDWRWLGFGHGS